MGEGGGGIKSEFIMSFWLQWNLIMKTQIKALWPEKIENKKTKMNK